MGAAAQARLLVRHIGDGHRGPAPDELSRLCRALSRVPVPAGVGQRLAHTRLPIHSTPHDWRNNERRHRQTTQQ